MHVVSQDSLTIIGIAQTWRSGMGATPVLPRAGGWLDQPAALMDAIQYAMSCMAKLEPKPRKEGAKR